MELSDLFYYEEGKLFSKVNRGKIKAGQEVGNIGSHGYLRCMVYGKYWLIHRIIYTLLLDEIPDGLQIDHINGDRLDNRVENLRAVTAQENMFNQTKAKGFHWNMTIEKFQAKIRKNGKTIHLGFYDTPQEARAAYLRAKEDLHVITRRT